MSPPLGTEDACDMTKNIAGDSNGIRFEGRRGGMLTTRLGFFLFS